MRFRQIKQISLFLLLVILISNIFPEITFSYTLQEPKGDWDEYKSTHFIIYYHPDIKNTYVKKFSRKCENYYKIVTRRLGFNRFDFWLWEDRAKIFIYKDKENYIKNTGRAGWSRASVNVESKIMNTFYFESDFFDVILSHELSHVILREFIGSKKGLPLWFDEGVACANEKDSLLRYLLVAKGFIDNEMYLSVPDMDRITSKGLIIPRIFYSTAASLMIFLLEEYGRNRFVNLCKKLRDNNSFYGAIKKVYSIKGSEDLDAKFIKYMKKKTYDAIANGDSFSVKW